MDKSVTKSLGSQITGAWEQFLEDLPQVLFVILQIVLAVLIARVLIVVIKRTGKRMIAKREKKEEDLTALHKYQTGVLTVCTVLRYCIYFMTVVTILSILNLMATVASVVAAAGVGGIVVGFGAQSLVQDFFSGLAMLFENQFAVGEYVKFDTGSGIVENITIRTTVLRAFTGETITIPNGIIHTVTNYSRGNITQFYEAHIAHGAKIESALQIMANVLEQYAAQNKETVVSCNTLGVESVHELGVELKYVAVTVSGAQWGVGRDLKRLIYEAFVREGIDTSHTRKLKMEDVS